MVKVTRILIEVSVAEVDSDDHVKSLANIAIAALHKGLADISVNTLDTHLSIAEETFDDEGEGPIEPLRMVQHSPAGEGMVQDSLGGGITEFTVGEASLSLKRTDTCPRPSKLVRPLTRSSLSSRTGLRASPRSGSSLLLRPVRSAGATPTSSPGTRAGMAPRSRSWARVLSRKLARVGTVQRSGVLPLLARPSWVLSPYGCKASGLMV